MKNSDYHMIVRVTDMDLKDAFISKAKKLGLTVSNDRETKTGIEHIELGHCISLGTSDKFHVNWAKRINYYAGREIVPVYDIQLDWKDIITRLQDYAAWVNESSDEFETEYGNDVYVDNDEQEVTIDDITLGADDIKILIKLTGSNVNVAYNVESDTFCIGDDVCITGKELEKIKQRLEK